MEKAFRLRWATGGEIRMYPEGEWQLRFRDGNAHDRAKKLKLDDWLSRKNTTDDETIFTFHKKEEPADPLASLMAAGIARGDIQMETWKFELRDRVRQIGKQEVRTVEQIRDNPPGDPLYFIQLGRDFATCLWASESDLELVCAECENPAAEVRQQIRESDGASVRWPVCEDHAKHFDGLAEALLGPHPSCE